MCKVIVTVRRGTREHGLAATAVFIFRLPDYVELLLCYAYASLHHLNDT